LKPQNFSFTEIAKRVGERWQLLTPKEKEIYESDAGFLKERYNTEFAKYKRTASYREYQQYLTEFKAKTAAANNGIFQKCIVWLLQETTDRRE
jgi:hypothetical protein